MIWAGFVLLRIFFRLFLRLRVSGWENIPAGGGVLFLSNHRSALDVLVIPWCIYNRFPQEVVRQVSKDDLFRIPIVGWIITQWRAFPVKRGAADLSSIRRLEEYVRRDKVVLYPEGTRSRDGSLGEGNRMVGRIIRNARPVVVPVAIRGTEKVVPPGSILPRPGATVEVTFGPPVLLAEEMAIGNAKASSQAVVDKVMASIAQLLGDERIRPSAASVAGRN